MGEAVRNPLESLQDMEACINRQALNLNDYHSTIRKVKDEEISLEDASKELQRIFQSLDTDFSDFDKKISDAPSTISSLGLASFMSNLPPINAPSVGGDAETTPGENKSLYEELISMYQIHDRSREYCNVIWTALGQYNFRKTGKPLRIRRPDIEESPRFIERWLKNFIMQMQLSGLSCTVFERPAMGIIVEVMVDRLFKVAIFLRGFTIEGVNVRSSEEYFNLEARTLKPADLWTPSELEVYRILTKNAHAAILHFQAPQQPDQAFKNFLSWINSLATLFSTPCRRCGKYLDNGLPPTFRDYRLLQPYHETCRLLSFTPI